MVMQYGGTGERVPELPSPGKKASTALTAKKVAGIAAGFEQMIQRLSPFLLRQIQQEARHETLFFPTFEVASPPALA
jgi:hypothetical protein